MASRTSDPHRDLELARRARAGDREAVSEFLDRMKCVHRMLAAKNAKMGRPFGPAELEDVTQEVLLGVWRKLDTFEGRSPLEAWVHRFATLELVYRLRRKDRRPALIEDTEARPEPLADEAPDPFECEEVYRALDRVGPPESDVIRMRHLDGLEFEAIAARSGEPAGTIKTRYYRGLQKARELLRPDRDTREAVH